MNEQEQSEQKRGRRSKTPTAIHFVLNWTHVSVFVAVAAIALITLNQGFASVDQRFDDMNLRMDERFDGVERRIETVERRIDRIETRLNGVEAGLSDINARLAVVEHTVGAQAGAEVDPPPATGISDSDL